MYAELAEYARGLGHPGVSAHAVHDWRKRGLLPAVRPGPRSAGLTPEERAPLEERVRAVCRYHYDEGVATLATVGLLLWLDGEAMPPPRVRGWLVDIAQLSQRLVNLAGSRARRSDRLDDEADIMAAAAAVARRPEVFEGYGGAPPDPARIDSAAQDVIKVATGRVPAAQADLEALSGMTGPMGLQRAESEAIAGVDPRLADDDPGAAFAAVLATVQGPAAIERIKRASDADLEAARSRARSLLGIIPIVGGMLELGFEPGAGGLGPFTVLARMRPRERAPLVALVALADPRGSDELIAGLDEGSLETWRETTELGRRFLEQHPELEQETRRVGLIRAMSDAGIISDEDMKTEL